LFWLSTKNTKTAWVNVGHLFFGNKKADPNPQKQALICMNHEYGHGEKSIAKKAIQYRDLCLQT